MASVIMAGMKKSGSTLYMYRSILIFCHMSQSPCQLEKKDNKLTDEKLHYFSAGNISEISKHFLTSLPSTSCVPWLPFPIAI